MISVSTKVRLPSRSVSNNVRWERLFIARPGDHHCRPLHLRQHLAAHPERALNYPWGSVAFRPLPSRIDLDGATKAYSPTMLDQVFDWDMELPEWDGLVCKIVAAPADPLERVRSPIGLAWRVFAQPAIIKRSRAPLGLFGKTLTQIPRGEFGLVYVAYTEGARSEIADNRTKALMDLIENVCHAIAALKPFDGAIQFLEQAASFGHVVIVSDSFSPMNSSILEILGCRISHGETMIILAQTVPQRATPSPPPSHSHPEPARHCFTQRNTSSARQRTAASDNSHMPRNV